MFVSDYVSDYEHDNGDYESHRHDYTQAQGANVNVGKGGANPLFKRSRGVSFADKKDV
jgi:hypothetical protein